MDDAEARMAVARIAGLTVRSIGFELNLTWLGVVLTAAGCGTVRPDANVSPAANSQPPAAGRSQSGQETGEASQAASYSHAAGAESYVPAAHATVIRTPSGRITAD
ncbi:MAG TPA: hypothetical protein VHC19_10690 [Pirellulales bacterium]|nr:hypothetical protein [Pirellulales bacterium]